MFCCKNSVNEHKLDGEHVQSDLFLLIQYFNIICLLLNGIVQNMQ